MKNKLKISEHDFKNYLLNHYVDEEGNKVSDRVLWSTQEFFDYTGMYAVNKFTNERQICSTGTISYWKKKLELKEEDIYNYHKNITKKITCSFEEWSRKNNKGYTRESTYNREVIKRKLIKYANLPKKYSDMSLDEISNLALKLWETLGINANDEMRKFYDRVV